MMDEDWKLLVSFFPANWRELAVSTNALKGLRKDKSEENMLRTLLIHLGCGYSLRETVVRARKADLADLSDVALLKRLRKCKDWLYRLCVCLFAERGMKLGDVNEGFRLRLFDATIVKEPGKTGSQWRIHYSIELPSLCCDFFKLTETQGKGTGESLTQFPVQADDYIIADRGYSTARGLHYIASKKAHAIVRLNPQALRICDNTCKPFALLNHVKKIKKAGTVKYWNVQIPDPDNGADYVAGRICAIRKTEEAIRIAHKKLKRRANRNAQELKPATLVYAKYVMVFTTFPKEEFSAHDILQWYRLRWQVELVFKRFKQIAHLGHLPKYDDESAKAWLYGKLFVALVTEKLIEYATSISPWGYLVDEEPPTKSLA